MAQIIVLSTKTQKKYTLDVNGNTLADLKAVMKNNQIDYSGMTFFEGRTKTELLSDQSQFPDNAIIRLTKSEKKITSGIEFNSRKDCQVYIQKHPEVAKLIKEKEEKNWTNCGTAVLIKYCTANASKSKAAEAPKTEAPVAKPVVKTEDAGVDASASNKEAWIQQGLSKGFITESDAALLRNAVKVEAISKEDMDMFNF